MQEIKAILRQQKNEHHEHLAAQVRDSSPATKQRVMDLLRKRVRRRGWLHCRWRIRVLTQTEFNAMMLSRLCFYVSLFVCLFVCQSVFRQDISKSITLIFMNSCGNVGNRQRTNPLGQLNLVDHWLTNTQNSVCKLLRAEEIN